MTAPALRRWKPLMWPLLGCALLAPAVFALTPAADEASPAQGAASTAAPAAAAKVSPTAAPAAGTPPVPLLWKVSDRDNSLYLLGSFHLLKAEDYPLSAEVDAAFDDAERLVFEVPPSELADPSVGQRMHAFAGFGDGRKLSVVLPVDTREKLGRMLGASGLAQLDGFEPWFVSLSLLLSASHKMGFQAEHGLDQHLMRRASDADKPTSGLETIDQQLQALDSTPLNEQIAGLQEFLDKPAEVPKMLGEMHDAWRAADLDRLNDLAVNQMREKTPETYRLINVARNDAWVPQLQAMLDDSRREDALVVVGAMHLLGSDGVVEKLQAKGYTVERVCSACAK